MARYMDAKPRSLDRGLFRNPADRHRTERGDQMFITNIDRHVGHALELDATDAIEGL